MFALLFLGFAPMSRAAVSQHGEGCPTVVHGSADPYAKRQQQHEAQRNDDEATHASKCEPLSSSEPHTPRSLSLVAGWPGGAHQTANPPHRRLRPERWRGERSAAFCAISVIIAGDVRPWRMSCSRRTL